MLNGLFGSGSVVEVDGRYKGVRRIFSYSTLTPEVIKRLGEVGYRVFSTAAKNIDKQMEGSGYFDRMVIADDGCTDQVIGEFDQYIKVRGQELLEEIDVWFSSRNEQSKQNDQKKDTGLYMVHYVESAEEKQSLREMLLERGIEAD